MKIDDYSRNTLRTLAKVGVLTVTFEKVDFGDRTMRCTLVPDYLDKFSKGLSVRGPRKPYPVDNNTPMRVFDIEAKDWRQFTPNRVLSASWEPADAGAIEKMFPAIEVKTFKVHVDAPANTDLVYISDAIKAGLRKAGYMDFVVCVMG